MRLVSYTTVLVILLAVGLAYGVTFDRTFNYNVVGVNTTIYECTNTSCTDFQHTAINSWVSAQSSEIHSITASDYYVAHVVWADCHAPGWSQTVGTNNINMGKFDCSINTHPPAPRSSFWLVNDPIRIRQWADDNSGLSKIWGVPNSQYELDVDLVTRVKDAGDTQVFEDSSTVVLDVDATAEWATYWSPTQSGNYTITIIQNITDCSCNPTSAGYGSAVIEIRDAPDSWPWISGLKAEPDPFDTTTTITASINEPANYTLYIKELGGSVVYLAEGETDSNDMVSEVWDGWGNFGSFDGVDVPDARYRISLVAWDSSNISEAEMTVVKNRDMSADSTPPSVHDVLPVDGSITGDNRTLLYANVTDSGGSGINLSSITMRLNSSAVIFTNTTTADEDGLAVAVDVDYAPLSDLADGYYTAEVSARDYMGNYGSASWHFTVDSSAPIISNIIVEPNPAYTGSDVTINATVTDANGVSSVNATLNGTTYQMVLSGGVYTVGTTAPAMQNTYWVTIDAADSIGNTATAKESLVVVYPNQAPVAVITVSPGTTVTEGTAVTLNGSGSYDTDGSIASYTWTENGSQLSTAAVFANVFAVGVHDVVLNVTDNSGAWDTAQVTITVQGVNNAPMITSYYPATDNVSVYAGDSQLFNVSAYDPDGDPITYTWELDSSPVSASDNFTYSPGAPDAGDHTLVITVMDNSSFYNASSVNSWSVRVNLTNIAPVADAGSDVAAVQNASFTLNGSLSYDVDGSIVSYEWADDQGEAIPAGATTTANFTILGNHTVSLNVTDDDGAWDTDAVLVTVTSPPANQPPVADAGSDQTVSVGQTVQFNGSGSYDPDGTIVSYAWDFGDGYNATGIAPTHPYSSAGAYTATLNVTDNNGAWGADTAVITVETTGNGGGGGGYAMRAAEANISVEEIEEVEPGLFLSKEFVRPGEILTVAVSAPSNLSVKLYLNNKLAEEFGSGEGGNFSFNMSSLKTGQNEVKALMDGIELKDYFVVKGFLNIVYAGLTSGPMRLAAEGDWRTVVLEAASVDGKPEEVGLAVGETANFEVAVSEPGEYGAALAGVPDAWLSYPQEFSVEAFSSFVFTVEPEETGRYMIEVRLYEDGEPFVGFDITVDVEEAAEPEGIVQALAGIVRTLFEILKSFLSGWEKGF